MRPLVAVMLATLLGGSACLSPPAPPPEKPSGVCQDLDWEPVETGATRPTAENAWSYLVQLVCHDADGEEAKPRPRVPGTPDHEWAMDFLEARLDAAGWDARIEAFAGVDYAAEPDKDGAQPYFSDPAYCSDADRRRLDGLQFGNVVAEQEGGSGLVLLAAHWDSKRFASSDPVAAKRSQPVLGANDGASGVAILLEVTRAWAAAGTTFPFDVRILLTDGEDGFEDCHPLAGSVMHAAAMSQTDIQRTRALLLLDMVGNGSVSFQLHGNSATLRDDVRSAAQRLSIPQLANARDGGGGLVDDHSPFMAKGIPAVDIIPASFAASDFWHTTHDTPKKLSPAFMGKVALLVDALVQEWADREIEGILR